MIRIRHIFVLTALALGVTAAPAAAQKFVPFKSQFTTTIVVFNPPDLAFVSVGNATHLGNTTGVSAHKLVFTSSQSGTQSGKNVYTAANGDQLFSDYVGTFSFDVNGKVTFSGTETFCGGTGRFSGATGTAQTQGTAIGSTGQFTATGTISK